MSDFSIRFLTREGCHLCDQARPLVVRVMRGLGLDWRELDIDQSDDLVARFGLRVPVVIGPDDVVVAEGIIEDEMGLRRAVQAVLG